MALSRVGPRAWRVAVGRLSTAAGAQGPLHTETLTARQPAGAEKSSPALVVLHGLYGSGQNWRSFGRALTSEAPCVGSVVLADLPDHGRSPHYAAPLTYAGMCGDVEALVRLLGPPVDLLGHSMGGKVAMSFALRHPRLVRRLVVVDIAPADYDPNGRAGDDEHPMKLAKVMLALDPRGQSRQAVSERLAEHVPNVGLRQFLLTNLSEDPLHPGQLRWRLNLPNLIASYGNVKTFPDPLQDPSLAPFSGPVLFVRGELSNYITQEHFAAMRALFPNHELLTIPGANHWPHFGPTARPFTSQVQRWLTSP